MRISDWSSDVCSSDLIVDKELSFLRIGAQDSTVDSTEDQFRLRAQYDLGGGWELRGLAALLVNREDTLNPKSFLRDASGAETFIGISGVNVGIAKSTELLAGIGLSGEAAGWKLALSFSRFDVLDGKERRSDTFDLVTGQRPNTGRHGRREAYWTTSEGRREE